MRKTIHSFLVCLWIVPAAFAKPVYDFNENCRNAYQWIIELKFKAADSLLNIEQNTRPDNVIPYFIHMKRFFLQTFISEEIPDFMKFKAARTALLKAINDADENTSPYALHFKSETALSYAILKVKFNELISAGYEFRKAYKLSAENINRYPSFLPNFKTAGVMHALVGAVPSGYRWLLSLLGFSGTIDQGMNELDKIYQQSMTDNRLAFLRQEILFINGFLKWHLQNRKEEALKMAEEMSMSDSPLLHFGAASIYMYNGENEKVLQLLENKKTQDDRYRILYLEYLHGIALLYKNDMRTTEHLEQYISGFKGTSFIRSAIQKKGWAALLQGDTAAYLKAMQQIIDARGDFTDEDKQALAEARSKTIPNPQILRSRLLFDGGYFNQAFKILASIKPSSLKSEKERVEYIYRLARTYEKLNDHEKAIRYYLETLNLGKNKPWYFAANSALLLGQWYEHNHNPGKASYYYNLCIDMKNHEYENSIEQKAQAGLNRIKNMK
jgi:tetratricopeptide (TPR) repeat protein